MKDFYRNKYKPTINYKSNKQVKEKDLGIQNPTMMCLLMEFDDRGTVNPGSGIYCRLMKVLTTL